MRAIGDSFSAGYGYRPDGSRVWLDDLLDCAGSESRTSACDAPQTHSYPAIWARAHDVDDFENLAITGATPADYLEGGALFDRTLQLIEDDPDLAFMTLGGNPFVGRLLWFMGDSAVIDCVESAAVEACAEHYLTEYRVVELLADVYRYILERTTRTRLVVLEYVSADSPLLHGDPGLLTALLNHAIERSVRLVAQEDDDFAERLLLLPAPSGFEDHGLDSMMEMFTPPVDFSFGQPLWVVNNDGGVHPNVRGMIELSGHITNRVWRNLPNEVVEGIGVSSLSAYGAKLNTHVRTGGFETAVRLEYEPAAYPSDGGALARQTPRLLMQRTPHSFVYGIVLDGLGPSTTYRYQWVATQQVGDVVKVTRSAIGEFTTTDGTGEPRPCTDDDMERLAMYDEAWESLPTRCLQPRTEQVGPSDG